MRWRRHALYGRARHHSARRFGGRHARRPRRAVAGWRADRPGVVCEQYVPLFVVLSGMVFFAWGEIYSLFPATCTDIYGRKFATTNYGLLYTAKGTAALLVPLANVLTSATGSWHAVFYVAAILNIVAAVMALVMLRPMRRQKNDNHQPRSRGNGSFFS